MKRGKSRNYNVQVYNRFNISKFTQLMPVLWPLINHMGEGTVRYTYICRLTTYFCSNSKLSWPLATDHTNSCILRPQYCDGSPRVDLPFQYSIRHSWQPCSDHADPRQVFRGLHHIPSVYRQRRKQYRPKFLACHRLHPTCRYSRLLLIHTDRTCRKYQDQVGETHVEGLYVLENVYILCIDQMVAILKFIID